MCKSEQFKQPSGKENSSLHELALEHEMTTEELSMCSYFLIAMRLKEKKIPADKLFQIINNWERIQKAVLILNHDLNFND